MNPVMRWLLDLLYPPKCMLCGRLMESSEQSCCGRCGHDLPEYDGSPPKVRFFQSAVAPFFYEGMIRDAILRFKFRGLSGYGEQFVRWMAVWVRDKLEGKYELISWVPCSRARRWTRGFDQAEILAAALGRELGVPVVRTLRKKRNNPKQSTRPDAASRRANVLGVYEAYQPERFSGKQILLVDDVLTTGATLSECGKVLRMAGSGDLVCAVIAASRRQSKE